MSPVRPLRPLQMQSDARLVELVRAGHERAFDALARRYRRPLLTYAGRLLGAEGRAEDALQQALLKAWIALRDGAEIDDVRAWLYRIVHNSAVTILRRAQLDCVELNDALDAAAPESEPESRLVMREMLSSLAALPELQRRAILLTAVSGRSHGEAAEVLGLSDGAVRGLVYRARASIRSAAAGLLPVGAFNWFAGLGQRRSSLTGRIAELAGATGGAGSAGVAAAVLKGGAIVVSAGALATAGQLAIPYVTAPHRTDRASVHSTGQPVPAARRVVVGPSPSASARVSVSLAAGGLDWVNELGGRPKLRRGDRDGGRGAGRGHSHRGGDGARRSTSGHGSPDGSGGNRASHTSGGSGGTPGGDSSGKSGGTSRRGASQSVADPSAVGGGGGGSGGGTSGNGGGTSTGGSGGSSGGSGNGGGAPGGSAGPGDGGGAPSGSAGPGDSGGTESGGSGPGGGAGSG